LREGKHHTAYRARDFLRYALKALPQHLKVKRIRADCGFFSYDFMKWLRRRGFEFFVAVPLQPWVQTMILLRGDWKEHRRGLQFLEINFAIGKTISVRFVVARTRIGKHERPKKQLSLFKCDDARYDYQVIATNSTRSPIEVWRFYNKRANTENLIKEGIYSFGLDHVVSHGWGANKSFFQLVMLSYNLMNWFKERVLGQRERKLFGETIRKTLLLIPAKLTKRARSYTLKLERSWFYRESFELALAKLE
jgi:hypothetical protein